MTIVARFASVADGEVKAVAEWWRDNRPAAPRLFDDELDALIERLKTRPDLGTEYQVMDGEIVRRTLLPTSAQHVYYVADEASGEIVIHTIWGARRGSGPKL